MWDHLKIFLTAYNFAKRLKTLKGLTSYEFICKCWTEEPKQGAVPDNYARYSLTHCLIWLNCAFGFGLLKRHSHSFKNSGKCSLGTPLNFRM